jgi:hypothetical protein
MLIHLFGSFSLLPSYLAMLEPVEICSNGGRNWQNMRKRFRAGGNEQRKISDP